MATLYPDGKGGYTQINPATINALNNNITGTGSLLNYSALNQASPYLARTNQPMQEMANVRRVQPQGFSSLAPSNQQMMEMANVRGQAGQKRTGAVDTPPNWRDNLLNYIVSPKGRGMAQGLLEASGYSEVPVTFGQALAMGMNRGTEAQTAADASAAAKAAAQFEQDKFAYQQKQDEALNWLKLKEILSKDSRTNIEKRMSAMFPNLVPGSPEYAEQAMKLLKSGAMTINLKDTPKGAGWLKLEEGTAQRLVDAGDALSKKWVESSGSLDQISKLRQAIMPLDESKFGKTAKFKMSIGNFLASIGIPINEQNQAMVESVFALGGEFVMGQIQNTKGAVSEREMAYFDNISPSLSKTKGGMILLLDLSKYALEEDKRRLEEWNKYQATWTEDMPMSQIMSGWNDILVNMKSEVPAKTKTAIENLVYSQAIKDMGDTKLILDPKNDDDSAFISQELGKANDGEGFLSSQFIGFTDNGLPKYLVETSENVFKKLVVNKD
tara:strand:+ start:1954 stop:3444 length:1491 start_codon:yes stop_codon:yes gene_type:complete